MSPIVNAFLGIVFLVLALVSTALMYQLWRYPFDKEKGKSAAPQWKMNIHRAVGFAFLLVYIILMVEMVPRLWEYQVELPARTVAHIMLGITIGVLLLIKLSILRFFRHFEAWMPFLGTGILLCTFLLLGLSLPAVYQERRLEATAPGGGAFTPASRKRVAKLLPLAGMPNEVDLAALSTESALRAGRAVLLGKCVQCHDLKTIISQPRMPEDWFRTVRRMARKPTLGDPIEPEELYRSTAFLIAITPDLQQSAKAKRADELAQQETSAGLKPSGSTPTAVDPAAAKALFEKICSQCHELSDVDDEPLESAQDVDDLIVRMIKNKLKADPQDLELVKWYLRENYVEEPEEEEEKDEDDDEDDDDDGE